MSDDGTSVQLVPSLSQSFIGLLPLGTQTLTHHLLHSPQLHQVGASLPPQRLLDGLYQLLMCPIEIQARRNLMRLPERLTLYLLAILSTAIPAKRHYPETIS